MGEKYQQSAADGQPDWSPGRDEFTQMYESAFDKLRFHKGSGFVIGKKGAQDPGPVRRLSEVGQHLSNTLTRAKDDEVFYVQSKEDNYRLLFRKHVVTDPIGAQVVDHEAARIGTPYIFGVTDCSWLDRTAYYEVTGILLPHKAEWQRQDPRIVTVAKDNVEQGDLLFIDMQKDGVHHVATWVDVFNGEGRVLDTEPHDTGAPAGWPTPNLGVGVRYRPMNPGYYCDWASVVSVGRVKI